MTETMKHPEMRNTVFGEVLAELLEAREIPVTPATVGLLAEEARMDGWKVINRMASDEAEYSGPYNGLAEALDLTEPEMMELAHAHAYEKRAYHPSRPQARRTAAGPREGGKHVS